jgi:hypothetical protein
MVSERCPVRGPASLQSGSFCLDDPSQDQRLNGRESSVTPYGGLFCLQPFFLSTVSLFFASNLLDGEMCSCRLCLQTAPMLISSLRSYTFAFLHNLLSWQAPSLTGYAHAAVVPHMSACPSAGDVTGPLLLLDIRGELAQVL